MQDAQGDGWVGGVSGYYNVWQMYDATTGELKNRGTLAENHDSGETKLCLEDGSYVFNTTASAAFAEDMQWGVCDKYGLAGACVGGGDGFYLSFVCEVRRPTCGGSACSDVGLRCLPIHVGSSPIYRQRVRGAPPSQR